MFGQQESYIENQSLGQKDFDESEKGSVRRSAERSDRIEGEREGVGFQEAGVTSDAREFRERYKT